MAGERDALRDWHRLFGLLLTDFFTGLPFTVEVERDLSEQQQFLDVVILRRGRGRMVVRLPDGLDDLAAHNLITFKSHREALDAWAIKELIGHYVAYRKLVSPSPSTLLPEDRFRLYAVRVSRTICQLRCRGTSGRRECIIASGGRMRFASSLRDSCRVRRHNAPLHLFTPSPELVAFGRSVYRRHSENTSGLLGQLFERFQTEGFAMSYTMQDFQRDYAKEHFAKLTPEEQQAVLRSLPSEKRREVLESWPAEERRELLESLPPEERLAGLSPEQIRHYLAQLTAGRPTGPRKPRRKK